MLVRLTMTQGRDPRSPFAATVTKAISGERAERVALARLFHLGEMFLKTLEPSPQDSLVRVLFALPDGSIAYKVAGRVTQSRTRAMPGKPAGMHLQLVKLDAPAQALRESYRRHVDEHGDETEPTEAEPEPTVDPEGPLAGARSVAPRTALGAPQPTPAQAPAAGPGSPVSPDPARGPVIGIDLGTTNSCAAVVEDGRARMLRSPEGYETIPSVLFVEAPSRVFVGHKAVQKMLLQPDRAIYGSKRFIGRPFTSREVGRYGHFFRYGLVADARGMTAAKLGERVIPLETVAALILKQIHAMVQADLGQPTSRCVITVPAYFGEAQRRAVMQAGQMAGLTVERILSEPTAAAVAFGFGRGLERTVLVYDLGGGTFDVSVVRIRQDKMEVLATDGDPFLGGSDFDDRLIESVCATVERKQSVDVRGDAVTVQRIREACEVAKRRLSAENTVAIELPHLAQTERGVVNFRAELSRDQYETLTADLVQRTIMIIDRMFERTGLSAKDVDEVILAGGQSRSLHIHRALSERFGKKPSSRVHPDHAVAIGAAVVGAGALGREAVVLTDILPATLRVVGEDLDRVILDRGTSLPARARFRVESSVSDTAEFVCTLYRGDETEPGDNELLGGVRLPSSLAEAVEGAEAEVLVEVSADGILTLSMRHPVTGQSTSLQLRLDGDGLATDESEAIELEAAD